MRWGGGRDYGEAIRGQLGGRALATDDDAELAAAMQGAAAEIRFT